MRAQRRVGVAVILLAPVLFWVLATGMEAAQRDPDAFEAPLAYLAFTWVCYLPVFGFAGAVLIAGQRVVRVRSGVAPVLGTVVGAGASVVGLRVAAAAYGLPMRAWPLCLVVGAAMGVIVLRVGSATPSQRASSEPPDTRHRRRRDHEVPTSPC
jgi:hypothetical protein